MSAGVLRQVSAAVRRGPVFDLPPFPEGHGVTRGDLVRIVDPAGLAVAWFDPGSARCVEFLVQSPEHDRLPWRSVFAVPDAFMADANIFGDGVPAAVGNVGPWITGVESGGDRPDAGWYLLERDPTSVIMQTDRRDNVGADAGDICGRLVAQLGDATLSLVLTVQNHGAAERSVAFGFRGGFLPGLGIDAAAASLMTTSTGGSSCVVVSCNEGVRNFGLRVGREGGNVAEADHGVPPEDSVLILAGASARLAISIAMPPVSGDVSQ